MSTKNIDMNEFRPARKHIEVSSGESVRIVREMQELSRSRLAKLAGIPKATLIAIEKDKIQLTVELAKLLAHHLKVPPAVIVEGWQEEDSESAA